MVVLLVIVNLIDDRSLYAVRAKMVYSVRANGSFVGWHLGITADNQQLNE